jgi:hypothetical protein
MFVHLQMLLSLTSWPLRSRWGGIMFCLWHEKLSQFYRETWKKETACNTLAKMEGWCGKSVWTETCSAQAPVAESCEHWNMPSGAVRAVRFWSWEPMALSRATQCGAGFFFSYLQVTASLRMLLTPVSSLRSSRNMFQIWVFLSRAAGNPLLCLHRCCSWCD